MAKDRITLLHYNIKELDTTKLIKSNVQVQAVKNVVQDIKAKHSIDLLSINEIQYDFPNVPSSNYQSKGQNLNKLRSLMGLNNLQSTSFNPANTGLNAKPNSDGVYYSKPNTPEARSHADQVNFGTLPGQYSSGLITKFEIKKENVFSKLKWKDFNPKIDLSKFKLANGKPYPSEAELFDKNFSDIVVDVDGKELHVILLHTVPSYHFGNKFSPNYKRNRDQLRFLEWYLTGSTDITVKLNSIKPLKKDAYYVATGDWNTAYDSTENPGSSVLRAMFKKNQLWLKDPSLLTFTNEGGGYGNKPQRLMLDYIAFSKNIKMIKGEILHPDFERTVLGCTNPTVESVPANFVLVEWQERKKTCKAFVKESYRQYKTASDHYPILGVFELN
jgi:hypothetical protein